MSQRWVREVSAKDDVDRLQPLLLNITTVALTKYAPLNFPNPQVDEIVFVYQPANRAFKDGTINRGRELDDDEDDEDDVETYYFWLFLDEVLHDNSAVELWPRTQISPYYRKHINVV